jgi:hypothetical protein
MGCATHRQTISVDSSEIAAFELQGIAARVAIRFDLVRVGQGKVSGTVIGNEWRVVDDYAARGRKNNIHVLYLINIHSPIVEIVVNDYSHSDETGLVRDLVANLRIEIERVDPGGKIRVTQKTVRSVPP